MILVDSVYINDGGGLVLLKYIIELFESHKMDVCYLMDSRTVDCFPILIKEKSFFIKNTISARKSFYKDNIGKYSKVFCFGNVPPPIKLNVPVYVYLHQKLFIEVPSDFSFKNKLIYRVKQLILNFYKKNTTKWIVQSELMRMQFAKKYYQDNCNNIMVLPFYPPLNFDNLNVKRQKNTFLYVSNASPHKNHLNLINAFCAAYDLTTRGSLVITVPESNVDLCKLINNKIEEGYPIRNVGFINRENLAELYLSHEYLIFPSLAESFGLGLAEAIDGGCKILASDLSYTYQVCSPSLTFNPYTEEGIKSAIIKAVSENLPSSKKIISNDIKQLISLLSE
ncbi:glycosyltransferase [Acinetobacter baumannii]|uniref:glycosyltransferase n=1 Tax=Acinetobacter baumannii TaxID=470 RepID=UPI00292BC81A|nr:glycosyltransferase [Acinetobacter baumannii]HEC0300395.1 glycosyltransferase [Acinetobacter baumannii]HEE5795709.1 glycosyltransferase [Acinetobacter baumannii]